MYEEIDTSGQTKWILPTIIVFFLIMSLAIVRFLGYPLGTPPFLDDPDLVLLIGFSPIGSSLLGILFGALRKRATKVNLNRLEFSNDVRELDDFGKVYFEGDYRTKMLGGHPGYICGGALSVILALIIGFTLLFGMDTIGTFVGALVEVVLIGVLYITGVTFGFHGTSIKSGAVNNPLYFRITKYLTKQDVVSSITQCDIVTDIIVKYKVGTGQLLKAVDDIHVFAITSTEPRLEIEITIEDMEDIGPEYTYFFPESQGTQSKEIRQIDGKDVVVIIDERDMNSFIRMRYDTGTIRARWNLATPETLCSLMHALVDEIARYRSIKKIPKLVQSSSKEGSIEGNDSLDRFHLDT